MDGNRQVPSNDAAPNVDGDDHRYHEIHQGPDLVVQQVIHRQLNLITQALYSHETEYRRRPDSAL